MRQAAKNEPRLRLGEASKETRGFGGPDIEMVGLWHKAGLSR